MGLASCGTIGGQVCGAPQRPLIAEYLYLGTDTPNGQVTAAQWNKFLSDVVSPLFPQGFTYWQANGQWKSDHGLIVTEKSYVLSVIREGNESTDASIIIIEKKYRALFAQEAVLRTSSPVCVSF
jgi:hypothetical protein